MILCLLVPITGCINIAPRTITPAIPQPSLSQPPALKAPQIISFGIQPQEILAGETATMIWETEGATSVEISPGIGAVPPSGQREMQPGERTSYTLYVSNSAGADEETALIQVNMNLRAKPIALSVEEMEAKGYGFYINSEPSIRNAISTYYIIFRLDGDSPAYIDNNIYLFRTQAEAEDLYAKDKYNNRNYVYNSLAIGTQGHFLLIPASNPQDPPTFSLFFQKNNAYIKIVTNFPYGEMESLARIVESRIK